MLNDTFNTMITIYILCLIITISIVLIASWKWDKENNQPTLRENMKDNIKEAKKILNEGRKKRKK